MNIGEINGVQVAVSPEAYEEIKKQKIIEENKILKELQEEKERYKNIIDEIERYFIDMFNRTQDTKYLDDLQKLKELKGSDKE